MRTVLRTARVVLREFTRADVDVLAAMMADKDQMSLYPRPRTIEEVQAWIDRTLSHYEDQGFGFWLMESVDRPQFLGYCGIRPRLIEGVQEVEMGWHTLKQVWNQGIATEAAVACRDLAFTRLNLPRLVAIIDPDNPQSIRVAEKIGMQLEKEAVVEGWSCLFYAIERDRDPKTLSTTPERSQLLRRERTNNQVTPKRTMSAPRINQGASEL